MIRVLRVELHAVRRVARLVYIDAAGNPQKTDWWPRAVWSSACDLLTDADEAAAARRAYDELTRRWFCAGCGSPLTSDGECPSACDGRP